MSCDPVSNMRANIRNSTSSDLIFTFASEDSLYNKSIAITQQDEALFQEDFSTIGGFLRPSLSMYDSVKVGNSSGMIYRVYTPISAGKNIYNIEESWSFSEPSKRYYIYDFIVNDGDIQ